MGNKVICSMNSYLETRGLPCTSVKGNDKIDLLAERDFFDCSMSNAMSSLDIDIFFNDNKHNLLKENEMSLYLTEEKFASTAVNEDDSKTKAADESEVLSEKKKETSSEADNLYFLINKIFSEDKRPFYLEERDVNLAIKRTKNKRDFAD